MKTHGGRAFLHGHLFGDNVHEYLAPCIYEGEGEMLGMGFFKSLIKDHGKAYFEPIGRALQSRRDPPAQPDEPRARLGTPQRRCPLRQVASSPKAWSAGTTRACRRCRTRPGRARPVGGRDAPEESARSQLGDEQAPAQAGRPPVPDGRAVATAARPRRDPGHLPGGPVARTSDGLIHDAADILCQDLRRKLTGTTPHRCLLPRRDPARRGCGRRGIFLDRGSRG